MGIKEEDFWQMSLAEIERQVNSYKRIKLDKAKEKATFNYIQAELIGRSIARVYSNKVRFPDIEDVYPTLFSKDEIEKTKREQQEKLSILRLEQFANSYNKKFKEEAKRK